MILAVVRDLIFNRLLSAAGLAAGVRRGIVAPVTIVTDRAAVEHPHFSSTDCQVSATPAENALTLVSEQSKHAF